MANGLQLSAAVHVGHGRMSRFNWRPPVACLFGRYTYGHARTLDKRNGTVPRAHGLTGNWSTAPARERNVFRTSAQTQEWLPPWAITFDIRERETEWTAENQARLVKLFAAEKLDIDILEAELRVAQLCLIVPKLRSRLKTIKPDILADLLRDLTLVADRLAGLKEGLPEADILSLAAAAPQILLQDHHSVVREVEAVAVALGVSSEGAQRIVSSNPRFLDAELVGEVLEELRRLMPQGDASATLRADPSWLLRVERGPKRLGPHPDDI